MKYSTEIQVLVIIGIGAVVGLLMASPMILEPMRNWELSRDLMEIYALIHLPASGLLAIWVGLGLPPYGDDGFILYPCAVVAQWVIIGMVAAVIVIWRSRKR